MRSARRSHRVVRCCKHGVLNVVAARRRYYIPVDVQRVVVVVLAAVLLDRPDRMQPLLGAPRRSAAAERHEARRWPSNGAWIATVCILTGTIRTVISMKSRRWPSIRILTGTTGTLLTMKSRPGSTAATLRGSRSCTRRAVRGKARRQRQPCGPVLPVVLARCAPAVAGRGAAVGWMLQRQRTARLKVVLPTNRSESFSGSPFSSGEKTMVVSSRVVWESMK